MAFGLVRRIASVGLEDACFRAAIRGGRAIQAGVTAYLLHNGSATYILWRA
jgi:hypothetical protein